MYFSLLMIIYYGNCLFLDHLVISQGITEPTFLDHNWINLVAKKNGAINEDGSPKPDHSHFKRTPIQLRSSRLRPKLTDAEPSVMAIKQSGPGNKCPDCLITFKNLKNHKKCIPVVKK